MTNNKWPSKGDGKPMNAHRGYYGYLWRSIFSSGRLPADYDEDDDETTLGHNFIWLKSLQFYYIYLQLLLLYKPKHLKETELK